MANSSNLPINILMAFLVVFILWSTYNRRYKQRHERSSHTEDNLIRFNIPAKEVDQNLQLNLGELLKAGRVQLNMSGVVVTPLNRSVHHTSSDVHIGTSDTEHFPGIHDNINRVDLSAHPPWNLDQGPDIQKRLPDCLIIGARKGGTWPLLAFLSEHPQVRNTTINSFFSSEEKYAQGVDWYRNQMPVVSPGEVLIEKTAEYFHNLKVPERVRQVNSSMKLILILRDPVERLISDYYSLRRFAMQAESDWTFQELYTPLEKLVYDEYKQDLNYSYGGLYRSKYIKFVQNWLAYFPREQMHIVDGDAFKKNNPASELQKIEIFLGLQSFFSEDQYRYDVGKGFWCSVKLNCFGMEKGHKFPPLDPNIENAVRTYLRPHNQELYQLIEQQFEWQ